MERQRVFDLVVGQPMFLAENGLIAGAMNC
jgi:hypothetical protein